MRHSLQELSALAAHYLESILSITCRLGRSTLLRKPKWYTKTIEAQVDNIGPFQRWTVLNSTALASLVVSYSGPESRRYWEKMLTKTMTFRKEPWAPWACSFVGEKLATTCELSSHQWKHVRHRRYYLWRLNGHGCSIGNSYGDSESFLCNQYPSPIEILRKTKLSAIQVQMAWQKVKNTMAAACGGATISRHHQHPVPQLYTWERHPVEPEPWHQSVHSSWKQNSNSSAMRGKSWEKASQHFLGRVELAKHIAALSLDVKIKVHFSWLIYS